MFEFIYVDSIKFPYETDTKRHVFEMRSISDSKPLNEAITTLFDYNDFKVIEPINIDTKAKIIKIYGYSSKEGTKEYNYTLSYKRALNTLAMINNLSNKQKVLLLPRGENCKYKKGVPQQCRKTVIEYIY